MTPEQIETVQSRIVSKYQAFENLYDDFLISAKPVVESYNIMCDKFESSRPEMIKILKAIIKDEKLIGEPIDVTLEWLQSIKEMECKRMEYPENLNQ